MSLQEEQHSPSLDVAEEVRDFYERYPYPRPVESLDNYGLRWQDLQRRRADHHLFWPAGPYREDHSILVAGCGTSQAAKHALRWPASQVIGIDFSATSVRCTEELKRKYDLRNLQVRQLPLERVCDLGTSFDQIVCTGVLHHLPDPDAGLRDLRSVLKQDGAMHLMVYAPYGRPGIYMLQEFCRRLGIQATAEGIRDLTAALKSLPPGHPLEGLLPQDRAYSVPQLFDFIKRGGMTFGRWMKQAPYSPHCGVMAQIPQASRMAELSPAEQYAAVELFRGTMVRHSAVVYRDDSPVARQQVSFGGDEWPGYVPIKMSDTICVEERLPSGAAAVLINQTHTYRDLYMPINATEKLLFNAIDGNCRIGEIVARVLPTAQQNGQHARTFFERLWWYDQVVFDVS
jgi:SAM-dependent methyltransferase